jgi:PAS domain S-box-containing protein
LYLVIICLSTFLIDKRGVIYTVAACSLAVIFLGILEQRGMLPAASHTITVTQWLIYSLTFGFGGYQAYMFVSISQQYLAKADIEIARRAQAEEALLKSEQRLRSVLEGLGDEVWEYDHLTDTVHVSSKWKSMLGYADADIGDDRQTFVSLLAPEDRQRAETQARMVTPGELPTFEREIRLRCKDGSYKWILARGKVISVDEQGNPRQSTGTLRDIDDLKRAQDRLIEGQKKLAILQEREQHTLELHDNLAQVLGYLAISSRAVRDQVEQGSLTAALSQLNTLSLAADSAIHDVREHIANLKPLEDAQGFTAVLKLYLARFERITGLRVYLSLPANLIDDILPEEASFHLLRIIQEALSKSRNHRGVLSAQITFSLSGKFLHVLISDDGVDVETKGIQNEAELQILLEHAELIGASLEIRSTNGENTQVIITIPYLSLKKGNLELDGVTVVIAVDHPLVAEGLQTMLLRFGMKIVGTAQDGNEAIRQAEALQPDIIILDIKNSFHGDSLAVSPIKQASPRTQVVMLSATAEDENMVKAVNEGASAFFLIDQSPEELPQILQAVLSGKTIMTSKLASQLAARSVPDEHSPEDLAHDQLLKEGVSIQQIDVMKRIAHGQTYRQIANELHISESGVKYHLERIQTILNLSGRAEVVAYAYKIGLVKDRRTTKPVL